MSENNSIFREIEVLDQLNEEIKRNIKILHIFRDFENSDQINVILVTNEDKVYCFGRNDCGVLGFGHKNSINEFTINEELSNKSFIDFKSGRCHTVSRDRNRKLYCWGQNRYLGNGREVNKISKPELNEYLINEDIIEICCGAYHTLVLTSNNEVYGWGYNYCGQIGNRSDEDVSIPFKLNAFNEEKVKAISCGALYSMALLESGCVYSWGSNESGQLGLNSENEIVNTPQRIQIEVEIKKISCGSEHSLLLSSERDIYAFGWNKYKQLGLETNGENQFFPLKLNLLEKFTEIALHYQFNMSTSLTVNGLYYVWGKCGDEGIINEPKKTQFKSFDEIFVIIENGHIYKNGKYNRNWTKVIKLGEGGYGKAYKVKNKLNENKIFAIKKIPTIKGHLKDYSKEFVSSSNILNLENEFLVKYYNIWFEENDNKEKLYILMDLCDKTLSAFHKEITEDSKLHSNNLLTQLGYYLLSEIFIEILKGVKYLHKNDIIHRDLNPDNILVKIRSNGNCIKIADFGLAKVYDKNKSNTGDIGNIQYSAPEVLDCDDYDMSADIYSLGIVLQQMFGIDFNNDSSEAENETSSLMFKYKNLGDLFINMTNLDSKERPNCEQIFKERENWAINKSEVNFIEELNLLKAISEENRSYVQHIIISKLFLIK